MEKCFLTNGDNLLRFHSTLNKFYFQKPDGEFLREVSSGEAEFLCKNCLEVDVHFPHPEPEFLPEWHFIASIRVEEDYSRFKSETCNNGGDYAFYTYHDWFMAKYPNGELKFAYVERFSTSAEFPFDELTGRFQSDLGTVYISNGIDCPAYSSQQGKSWDGKNVISSTDEVLEKVGTIADFKTLWNEVCLTIPERDSEEEEYETLLTLSEKKEIVTRVKEIFTLLGGYAIKKNKRCIRNKRR